MLLILYSLFREITRMEFEESTSAICTIAFGILAQSGWERDVLHVKLARRILVTFSKLRSYVVQAVTYRTQAMQAPLVIMTGNQYKGQRSYCGSYIMSAGG